MKIKTILISILATCLFFVASFYATGASAAPRLYFDPASSSPQPGTDISVDVLIDVGTSSTFGADATINIPSEITVKSITNGGFYDTFTNTPVTNGQIELHGFLSAAFATKTGNGTFAHLVLTTNKVLGSSTLSFQCSAGGADTEILNGTGQNILSCSSLNQFVLSYPNATPVAVIDGNTYGTPNACGGTCGSNYNCASGLFCSNGFCRNPDCSSSTTCGACPTPTPTNKPASTVKPIAKATPVTVTLAKTTPYPTPAPSFSPTPAPQIATGKPDFASLAVWSGLGLIAIIVILMTVNALKKKTPPQIKPPTTGMEDTYRVEPPLTQTPPQNPPTQFPPPTGF